MKKIEIEKAEGMELHAMNGKITYTHLGYEHTGHGIFSNWIGFEYSGGSHGYGGFSMDGHKEENIDLDKREPTKFGCALIMKICQVFRNDWENLIGTPLRVIKKDEYDRGSVIAIGHYMEDDWVYIKDLVKTYITDKKEGTKIERALDELNKWNNNEIDDDEFEKNQREILEGKK